jgi:hypothetical protein
MIQNTLLKAINRYFIHNTLFYENTINKNNILNYESLLKKENLYGIYLEFLSILFLAMIRQLII